MASSVLSKGQHYLECDTCKSPVDFTCKRCAVKLCNACIEPHLLMKSKSGHDVTKYNEQNKINLIKGGECLTHPQQQSSALCKTCDIPICVVCVLNKHKPHDIVELSEKVDELSEFITTENEKLQSMRSALEKILEHLEKRSSSLRRFYKQTKGKISSHAKIWHKEIDKAEKALHKDLNELQEKHTKALKKQKKEFDEILIKLKNIKQTASSLAKSKDVSGLMEFKLELENLQVPTFIEEPRPALFHPNKFNGNYKFGYIETLESQKLPIDDLIQQEQTPSSRQALDVPTVMSSFDTKFPASENNNRLYDMVPLGDDRVWTGGASNELKLFDLQGRLLDTVSVTNTFTFLTIHDGHVVYTDSNDNTVKKVINGKVDTLFSTGEWEPKGITCTAACDFLVCLRTTDQTEFKVVRYSSSGDMLQEIQYDSQYQPLFKLAAYVVENGNGDICVADYDKGAVRVVDKFGIFRFSYTGIKASKEVFLPCFLTTDSMHHIIITDDKNDKIHMLDRDGRFLRYIIPDQGIRTPLAVCVVREGELMVLITNKFHINIRHTSRI